MEGPMKVLCSKGAIWGLVFSLLLGLGEGTAFATHQGLEILEELEHGLVSLAEKVRPTVVSLTPYVPPSPSVRLKDQPGVGRPTNAGSGVFFDGTRGLIVTNNHVVRNAEKVTVTLMGGEEMVGTVLGVDEDTDLAVVQVEPTHPLPSAEFDDSSKIRVGQFVLAVGNPYGLNDTLTFGIISGLNRENINLSRYEDYIQTDASINPGNSGGPLLNIHGKVIGINTAIINYAQSIGFAIPSNVVNRVVKHLIEYGQVRRGWLGVGIEPVSQDVAERAGVKRAEGVYVNTVFEGEPAARAGLQVGDIILKIGGAPVNSPSGMIRVVGAISPGQTVAVQIVRNGKEISVPIILGEQDKGRQFYSRAPEPEHPLGLGFTVETLTEALVQEHHLGREMGVVVASILPESIAYQKGLRKGDLVQALNGEKLQSRKQFENIMEKLSVGSPVFLLVLRNEEKFHLALVNDG